MILITGATGTVGTWVLRHLRASGATVRAGTHVRSLPADLAGPTVSAVPFDFDDMGAMRRAMDGVDHVYLLTPGGPRAVEMVGRALEAARAVGVGHIVRHSAMGAEMVPGTPLLRWHHDAERLVVASGIPWTIVRPNSYMENTLNCQGEAIRREHRIYLPLHDAKVSFVAACDVGAVAAHLLSEPSYQGHAFDLTGPAAVDMAEFAHAISRAVGHPVNYVSVSEDVVRTSMAGTPEVIVEASLEFYAYNRAGYLSPVTGTVHEITGHPPQGIAAWAVEHAAALGGPADAQQAA